MGLTDNPHDGCLHEILPNGQQQCYLILPDGERKNLVRPVYRSYTHIKCGAVTTMAQGIAETYASNPRFYGGTFCARCGAHFPVGDGGEFIWPDGTLVGTEGYIRSES